jgi:hypothetical protein
MSRSIAPAPVLEADPLGTGMVPSSGEGAEKRRFPASSWVSTMSAMAHQHATSRGLRLHSCLDREYLPRQIAAFA